MDAPQLQPKHTMLQFYKLTLNLFRLTPIIRLGQQACTEKYSLDVSISIIFFWQKGPLPKLFRWACQLPKTLWTSEFCTIWSLNYLNFVEIEMQPVIRHLDHYRTPWVCRVSETLGKIPKTLGKLFAECNTRWTALAINSSGKANFAECHLSGTRQPFCRVQFSSRRKETVITPDPPLTATSPSVKRQGTRQIFFKNIFGF